MKPWVVMVDDDEDDLVLLEETVKSIDPHLKCVRFTCPVRALAHLTHETQVPTFIFLDYNMPKMRGDELLKRIRRIHRLDDSVIAVLSTGMTKEISDSLKTVGADFAMPKAANSRDFDRSIQSVITPAAVRLTHRDRSVH